MFKKDLGGKRCSLKARFGPAAQSSLLLLALIYSLTAASDAASPRGHFQSSVPSDVQTQPSPAQQPQEQKLVYGRSVQDRPLEAFVLGSGTNITLIFGGFPGNERSGPGVVEKLHVYLQQHPEEWRNCQVILVPDANPDGWKASTHDNAHRVDLNRNFPGTWKSAARAARYNPGPSAASEPETQAIMHLVTLYSPTKVISIHQPLHLLNWTGPQSHALAAAMARQSHYSISEDVGYPTPGSFGDYCGGRGITIVTLEMPNGSVARGWRQNRQALLAAITCRTTPAVTIPTVTKLSFAGRKP